MKIILAMFFFATTLLSPEAKAAFKKVKLERVNIELSLPERLEGDDWTFVAENPYGGYKSSSRVELICTISSPDIFLGRTSGILRAVAEVEAEKTGARTFRVYSIDQSKPFHESRATGVLERRHSCYVQGQFNLINQVTGKVERMAIMEIDAGDNWKLSNRELIELLETAYID